MVLYLYAKKKKEKRKFEKVLRKGEKVILELI